MEKANQLILALDAYLGSAAYFPWVLLSVGLFFTIYLGFPQLRLFKHAWSLLFRKKSNGPSDSADGDISQFQALSTALSGTVGTGNIGGVALAIHLGGPPALFWMWVTAFVGMATKYVEVTLSHRYRVHSDDGISGGPMYYMERRLNMRWLAVIFAVATVLSSFGTGSMPQVNNIAQSLDSVFGIQPFMTGAVLSVILGLVIIGGIKRIAHVTEFLVPSMAVIYFIGALGVIVFNSENLIPSFQRIFSEVFSGASATGGFLGAAFAYAFNRGVNRGLYSNEAGQGSAPIAHASAKTKDPASEGAVAILEPFLDTIIICTVTGLAILASGAWIEKYHNNFQSTDMLYVEGIYSEAIPQDIENLSGYLSGVRDGSVVVFDGELQVRGGQLSEEADGQANGQKVTLLHARSIAENVRYSLDGQGYTGTIRIKNGKLDRTEYPGSDLTVEGKSLLHSAALTTKAFTSSVFGEYGEYIVAIGLTLFAFSTAIAWSYYGDRSITYLFGSKGVMPYRVVYIIGFFFAAIMDTSLIWNIAAVTIVLMTLPNLFGISLLFREMKQTTNEYCAKIKASANPASPDKTET